MSNVIEKKYFNEFIPPALSDSESFFYQIPTLDLDRYELYSLGPLLQLVSFND
jgi:hypothetical protein